jgi:hypothetical protein
LSTRTRNGFGRALECLYNSQCKHYYTTGPKACWSSPICLLAISISQPGKASIKSPFCHLVPPYLHTILSQNSYELTLNSHLTPRSLIVKVLSNFPLVSYTGARTQDSGGDPGMSKLVLIGGDACALSSFLWLARSLSGCLDVFNVIEGATQFFESLQQRSILDYHAGFGSSMVTAAADRIYPQGGYISAIDRSL